MSMSCNLIHKTRALLCAVPYVGIVQDRRQEKVEEHHHSECVARNIERSHEWVTRIVDLSPVNADRNQTKSGIHLRYNQHQAKVRKDPQLTPKIVLTF